MYSLTIGGYYRPMIIVYTDGSCRNNPGKAACHWIYIHGDDIVIPYVYHSIDLKEATNNRAEIVAVESALAYVMENAHNANRDPAEMSITVKTDSETVIAWIKNGVNGDRVWNREQVQKTADNINIIREKFKEVIIEWIPRYLNKADPAHKV